MMLSLITNQHFLKEWVPICILTMYVINTKIKGSDYFFTAAVKVTAVSIPLTYILYHLGVNPFDYLQRTWTTLRTPIQYLSFILLTYIHTYTKTNDIPYSFTLAIHSASAAGYIYEIPRFLVLQGLSGVFRFNKYSPIRIEYSIFAILIIVTMLFMYNYTPTRYTNVAALLYIAYFIGYPTLQRVRVFTRFHGIQIPWINLYRLPAMLLLFSLSTGLTKRSSEP